jgi:methionyl-tRNA formyltransferase
MVLRAIWLSANLFGFEVFKEALSIKNIEIKSIFTLEKDSNTIMYDGIDTKLWYNFGIPVYEVNNINDHVQEIKKLNVDLIIMCGWRQIINHELLETPSKGIIGFHPTLLPKGRGPAPIINTILEGYSMSGVTMYYISEGLDDGDIIGQEPFFVTSEDYANDVYKKIIQSGKKLINIYLPKIIEGTAPRIPQKTIDATYFPKRTLRDNKINFEEDSIDLIYRKIRAFSKPYRGAYLIKDNKKIIIWNADIGENI